MVKITQDGDKCIMSDLKKGCKVACPHSDNNEVELVDEEHVKIIIHKGKIEKRFSSSLL